MPGRRYRLGGTYGSIEQNVLRPAATVFRLIMTEHAANARLTARTRQQLAAAIARTLILSTPTQFEARTAPRPGDRPGVSPDRLLGVTNAGAGSRPVGAAPTPTWLMNCCVPCHGGFGEASVRWTNCERREARKRDDRRSLAIG